MAKITRTCFCYRIVRFFRVSTRRKVIAVGLTRAQAMEHCSRPDTSRAGVWFDGFEMMPGYADYTVAGVLPGAGDPPANPLAVDSVPAVDPVFDCFEVMPVNDWIDLVAVMPYNRGDEGGYWD